ncbi:MAG: hypothetical protein NTX38_05400 [Methylobacter sp.]|nr:hypothetical protein [Methylobacter sp.]
MSLIIDLIRLFTTPFVYIKLLTFRIAWSDVSQHGCHACQGYLLSKPVPLEEFELLLQNNTALSYKDF